MYAHLQEEPPRCASLRPSSRRELDEVVCRAMAKDPDDRYPSAGDFARAAAAAVEGRRRPRPSATSASAPPRRARPRRRRAPSASSRDGGGGGRRGAEGRRPARRGVLDQAVPEPPIARHRSRGRGPWIALAAGAVGRRGGRGDRAWRRGRRRAVDRPPTNGASDGDARRRGTGRTPTRRSTGTGAGGRAAGQPRPRRGGAVGEQPGRPVGLVVDGDPAEELDSSGRAEARGRRGRGRVDLGRATASRCCCGSTPTRMRREPDRRRHAAGQRRLRRRRHLGREQRREHGVQGGPRHGRGADDHGRQRPLRARRGGAGFGSRTGGDGTIQRINTLNGNPKIRSRSAPTRRGSPSRTKPSGLPTPTTAPFRRSSTGSSAR